MIHSADARFALGSFSLWLHDSHGTPLRQSESVPICLTVFELYPSMPTQNDEYWVCDWGQAPWIAGTIQEP